MFVFLRYAWFRYSRTTVARKNTSPSPSPSPSPSQLPPLKSVVLVVNDTTKLLPVLSQVRFNFSFGNCLLALCVRVDAGIHKIV